MAFCETRCNTCTDDWSCKIPIKNTRVQITGPAQTQSVEETCAQIHRSFTEAIEATYTNKSTGFAQSQKCGNVYSYTDPLTLYTKTTICGSALSNIYEICTRSYLSDVCNLYSYVCVGVRGSSPLHDQLRLRPVWPPATPQKTITPASEQLLI